MAGKQFRMHPDGQNFFVVGPVENADFAAFGERSRCPPQKIVIQFLGRRGLERVHLAALRVHSGHDVLDGAVLTGGVHGLQDQKNGPAVLGIKFFLQFGEADDSILKYFLGVLLGFQAERFRGIKILQAEMRSMRNLKRFHKFP